MVSTRGVKFKFSEGERVLCYEPDPTKAKVLYESKVLQLVVSRDNRGRKIPEYLVHFYGWNSSWDRCVIEEFVLPDTEENRNLQTRLSQEAAIQLNSNLNFRKGKKKHKLPSLLKGSFQVCKKQNTGADRKDHSEDDQSDRDSESSEDDEEEEDDDNQMEEGEEEEDDHNEDGESGDEENDAPNVVLAIPDSLKDKLEDDCFMITCKNKVISVPCEPNVVGILEGYVKHVAVGLACASPLKGTRQQLSLAQNIPSDIEMKIEICKEVIDGLRIYFDFCLPAILLYRQEKAQFLTINLLKISAPSGSKNEEVYDACRSIESVLLPSTIMQTKPKQESEESFREVPITASPVISSPVPTSPEPRTTRQSRAATRPPSPPPAVTNASKAISRQYRRGSQSPNSSGEDGQTTKRVLRSTDKLKNANDVKSETPAKEHHVDAESGPESPQLSPKILRNSPRSLLPVEPPPKTVTVQQQHMNSVSSPPPNQTSVSSVGSSASSTHSSVGSSGEGPATNGRDTSGLLNEVLSWQMIPVHLYDQVPPLPSLVYGAHHLLRLFVKLPELVQKMNIPKKKRECLLKELENFLRYLQDKSEELLVDSVYINKDQTVAVE